MKYVCLGYLDQAHWTSLPEPRREAVMDECFAYDEELQQSGHWAGGEALQSVQSATTLRLQNGKVTITDGPFAETKEQLGGILVLEANDLNHAIQIMSKHPGLKTGGCFEVRPAADLSGMVLESAERRKAGSR